MRDFYIVIEDDDRELVYKRTQYSPLHDIIAKFHPSLNGYSSIRIAELQSIQLHYFIYQWGR
jgi:hypothetical protein